MRKKILVVDDEPDLLEVVEYNLKRDGFSVSTVADGESALRQVREEVPDLIILDLMLPGIDGYEVCKRIRQLPDTRRVPIIMLTAREEESDVVLGLGVGADDYVTKPFRPKELVARVKAVLRRVEEQVEPEEQERVTFRELVIDSARHEVTLRGEEIGLTLTEFRLLRFLVSHPGRVFTRAHLIEEAIGRDVLVIDRNIDVHVRALRKKLGDYASRIETVRGVGYRFSDRE